MSAETSPLPDPLAAIHRDYAQRLPSRVRRLARAARAARGAPDDARAALRARDLAHTLRGTAGSYGFAAIAAAAGRVEDALRRADWDEIDAALRDAEALASIKEGGT